MPWNKVFKYNVRQQELFEEKMSVLSSNGLEIKLDASVLVSGNYSYCSFTYIKQEVKPTKTMLLYLQLDLPLEVLLDVIHQNNYILQKETQYKQKYYEETKKILSPQYIQLNSVLVRDVTLPPTIKTAIERKLKQEQESLEYEF